MAGEEAIGRVCGRDGSSEGCHSEVPRSDVSIVLERALDVCDDLPRPSLVLCGRDL